jgi:hypothetical protein
MRSFPGSFRARTSLRTRADPLLMGRLAESASIACRESWMVMIVSSVKWVNLR